MAEGEHKEKRGSIWADLVVSVFLIIATGMAARAWTAFVATAPGPTPALVNTAAGSAPALDATRYQGDSTPADINAAVTSGRNVGRVDAAARFCRGRYRGAIAAFETPFRGDAATTFTNHRARGLEDGRAEFNADPAAFCGSIVELFGPQGSSVANLYRLDPDRARTRDRYMKGIANNQVPDARQKGWAAGYILTGIGRCPGMFSGNLPEPGTPQGEQWLAGRHDGVEAAEDDLADKGWNWYCQTLMTRFGPNGTEIKGQYSGLN